MTPTTTAESPKTKHSSGKGKHHHSLGHGSNTSTLKCPDSTLAKKPSGSKEQVNRTSLPRIMALANVAGSPLCLQSQTEISGRRPTQKTPANSTPPSPLAPVSLMASAVQWGPTVRQLSSNPLPSPQHLWGLAPHDNGNPYQKKVSAR